MSSTAGGQGFDYIYGGSGDDRIETGGGAFETAWGEAGNDVLTAMPTPNLWMAAQAIED